MHSDPDERRVCQGRAPRTRPSDQHGSGRAVTSPISKTRNAWTVVFIGADFKDVFSPNTDPIGKIIGVDGRPFQVIGVGKAKGSVFGQSQDNYVYDPGSRPTIKIYGAQQGITYNFTASEPRSS